MKLLGSHREVHRAAHREVVLNTPHQYDVLGRNPTMIVLPATQTSRGILQCGDGHISVYNKFQTVSPGGVSCHISSLRDNRYYHLAQTVPTLKKHHIPVLPFSSFENQHVANRIRHRPVELTGATGRATGETRQYCRTATGGRPNTTCGQDGQSLNETSQEGHR